MDILLELSGYILLVIAGIIPIVNPFSSAPVFMALTAHVSSKERRSVAMWACIYMSALLIVFLALGALILQFFGISLLSLRLAGGMVIAYMGFRMLFPSEHQENSAANNSTQDPHSLTFTPLAIPMLCGPGSISVVLAIATDISQVDALFEKMLGYIVVSIGIMISAFICFLVLWSSGKVVGFLGKNGINAVTKLMGFFLICVGVEFVVTSLNLDVILK